MSGGLIAGIVVIVLLVLVAAVAATRGPRFRTRRLRRGFGAEYDRAVARNGGDARAAERELERARGRWSGLDRRPVAPEVRERYELSWAHVQERFVEAPSEALAEGRGLLDQALRERGYPVGSTDETALALAVHDPGAAERYRAGAEAGGNAAARDGAAEDGASAPRTDTEALREALLRTRELLGEVLGTDHGLRAGGGRAGGRRAGAGPQDRAAAPAAAGTTATPGTATTTARPDMTAESPATGQPAATGTKGDTTHA